jgi:hypothetical protein
MTTMMKYTLEQIYNISAQQFEYVIPEETINIINYLAKEVGCHTIITKNEFKSKQINTNTNINTTDYKYLNKKKKKNQEEKGEEEWRSETFQATTFKTQNSCNEIDQIRLQLNKLTDKTYHNISEQIIKNIENVLLCEENIIENKEKISKIIYEISSNNKFYSVIYAKLYKELCEKYTWLEEVFINNFKDFGSKFKDLEYIEPNENYDRYCELNKMAEIRKSNTLFFLNLAKNGFIKPLTIYTLLRRLITNMLELIHIDNQKNAVDDIVENIALLFDKDIISEVEDDEHNDIEGFQLEQNGSMHEGNIIEFIELLSTCKASQFKSLTHKSIFKFMDLVE